MHTVNTDCLDLKSQILVNDLFKKHNNKCLNWTDWDSHITHGKHKSKSNLYGLIIYV